MPDHLTFRQQVAFAGWFARRDLFEETARAVSWAIITAMALSSAGAIVAIALPGITEHIRRDRLQKNPLSRCLWVSGYVTRDSKFDAPTKERLQHSIQKRLANPDITVAVAGYHVTNYTIADANLPWDVMPEGRVLRTDDPLFPAMPRLIVGEPSIAADKPGVILSPKLLAMLKQPLPAQDAMVRFLAPLTGKRLPIPVIGTTHAPLPQGCLYVLTAAADDQIRAAEPSIDECRCIWTGFLPPTAPTSWSEYPGSLRKLVRTLSLAATIHKKDGRHRLQLCVDDPNNQKGTLKLGIWQGYVQAIAREIPGTTEDFLELDPGEQPHVELKPRGPDDRATVYVSELSGLEATAEAVETEGLYVNASAIPQLKEIEATANRARWLLSSLVVVFCLGSLVSLAIMLYLRAQRQAAQTGLLRAIGTADRQLGLFSTVQVVWLWLLGTCGGALLAAFAGLIAAIVAGVTVAELWGSLASGRWLIGMVVYFFGSLFGSIVSATIALRSLRNASPATTLGLTS